MADDRLSCCRSELIVAINSDKLFCRWSAISFRLSQNASSRLTLVLWPAITTERLTTGDFIEATPPTCTYSQHPTRKFARYYGRLKNNSGALQKSHTSGRGARQDFCR